MKDIIDQLMDESTAATVQLYDSENKPVAFEQIALIPFDGEMFAILAQKEMFDRGETEHSAIVVRLDFDARDIEVIEDADCVDEVFAIYDRLFDEQENG